MPYPDRWESGLFRYPHWAFQTMRLRPVDSILFMRKGSKCNDAIMTEHSTRTVLLTASPGPLRDALRALLLSLPLIQSVAVAGDPEAVVKAITANLIPPGLVVVVLESQPAWRDLPQRIRAAAPACRITVLADGEGAGDGAEDDADLHLQQGTRPEALVSALMLLLNDLENSIDGGQNGQE